MQPPRLYRESDSPNYSIVEFWGPSCEKCCTWMILQNSDVFAQLLNAKKLEEEVVAEYGDMRGE